jgi:hypothetical protein
MVCTKCEAKLRAGSALVTSKPVSRRDLALGATESLNERRPINENKALASKRRGPYGVGRVAATKCATCRCSLHTGGTHCNVCAHAAGVCSQCGIKIMDTSAYNGHDAAALEPKTNVRDAAVGVKDRRDVSTADFEKEEDDKKKEQEDAATMKVDKKGPVKKKAVGTGVAVARKVLAGPTSAADAAREMGQAANGGEVSGWRFDSTSGYYYDVAAQVYYDPKTGGYFDCKTQMWTMPEAATAAQRATGAKTGSFKDGTRKPDKFGL